MNKKKDILASGRQLANTAAIMRYLAHNGPVSQLQVVEDTPLKRTSIFNIFEQLDQAGLVVVNSSVPALRKGRPSQLWEVNPSAGSFFVAYLSNSEEHYNVYDFTGAVQENVSCKSAEKFDDAVLGMVDRFRDWKTKYSFRAVIVVLPGAVDSENGTVVVSRTWHVENIPLAEKIGKILEEDVPGIPVVIENNARMAAWGKNSRDHALA